jgi:uncharacterized protein
MAMVTTEVQESSLLDKFDLRFSSVDALIIKVTKRCNLNCEYCYENITKTGDMDIDVFRSIAQKAFFNSSKNRIQFIFHGGEPTLLPNSWYNGAFEICKTFGQLSGKEASLSIQTNLTRLTDEKIQLFKENDVSVGVSLDGPSDLSDSMRPGSELAVKNFFRARDSGLDAGILMTINQSNFNKFPMILDWLSNDMAVKDFKANVVYSVGTGNMLPDMKAEEIFMAQKSIVDYMIECKGEKLIEHNLVQQIDWFSRDNDHETKSLCQSKTCGAGTRVLGITSDGNLLPCGRFQWNDSDYFLGNLAIASEIEEFENEVSNFHSLNSANWLDCDNCSARKICGFGCQAFISRSNSRLNVECLATKKLYEYFVERKADILELHQHLLENKRTFLDAYGDSKYGDGTKTPYSDVYLDKYSDKK